MATHTNLSSLFTDIADSIRSVSGGTASIQADTFPTAIQSLGSGFAKIQTGSYVGTGTYGASNPCSLTFDFNLRYITWCGSWGQHNYGATQTTYYEKLFTSNSLSDNLLENTTSPFLTTSLLTNAYRRLGLSYIYTTNKYFLYAKY